MKKRTEERTEQDIKDILDKLDFSNIQSLMQSLSELNDLFPDFWEMEAGLLQWSPMAKMQYKQLKYAGEWLRDTERKGTHDRNPYLN